MKWMMKELTALVLKVCFFYLCVRNQLQTGSYTYNIFTDDVFVTDPITNKKTNGAAAPKTWYPITTLWDWSEGPGEPQMVSIDITLPSGVENKKDKSWVVVNDACNALEITVVWPDGISKTEKVHQWVPSKDNLYFHPRLAGYERALAKLRKTKTEKIKSTASIALPFKVLKKIHMVKRFGFKDETTRKIYVDLEADKHSNYVDEDEEEEEIL